MFCISFDYKSNLTSLIVEMFGKILKTELF